MLTVLSLRAASMPKVTRSLLTAAKESWVEPSSLHLGPLTSVSQCMGGVTHIYEDHCPVMDCLLDDCNIKDTVFGNDHKAVAQMVYMNKTMTNVESVDKAQRFGREQVGERKRHQEKETAF